MSRLDAKGVDRGQGIHCQQACERSIYSNVLSHELGRNQMRVGALAGCLFPAFILLLPLASDAQQQPTNPPQINSEKQPDNGVKPKDGAGPPQQQLGPNTTPVSQSAAGNGDAQREPNLGDARDQGTDFWPPVLGHKIRITDSLLVLFTALLWLATLGLVNGANKSAKRELRAYVVAQAAGLQRITPNDTVFFPIAITNAGKTPAYQMRQSGEVFIADYPLPMDYRFPTENPLSAPTTLFPNTQALTNVVATNRFTQAQLAEALQAPIAGGRRLYCCGRIRYVDAFGKQCWTAFCVSFCGHHPAVELANAGNWEGVEASIHGARVGLAFEAATTHNGTEDG